MADDAPSNGRRKADDNQAGAFWAQSLAVRAR